LFEAKELKPLTGHAYLEGVPESLARAAAKRQQVPAKKTVTRISDKE
jgi:hypothetical protein